MAADGPWLSRVPLFWKLQIGGWLLLLVLSIPFRCWAFGSVPIGLAVVLLREPLAFVLSLGLREIYRRWDRDGASQPLFPRAMRVIGLSFGAGALDIAISYSVLLPLGIREVHWDTTAVLIPAFIVRSALYTVWSVLYFWLRSLIDAREHERRLAQAESAAQRAELQMLRHQVNPHFLFNSLNAILAEADDNPRTVKALTQALADYLRYSLDHRDSDQVPLGTELDAITSYLDVEKIRFEEGLDVTIDVEEAARAFPVPGILLHPLVENAVRYGMQTSESPLRLRLTARLLPGSTRRLRIEVANTGRWLPSTPLAPERQAQGRASSGVGLTNLRQRLAILYPGCHHLEIDERDGWVGVAIELAESRLEAPAVAAAPPP